MKVQRYLGLAALVAASVVPVLEGATPAGAQQGGCEQDPTGSECTIGVPVPIPGDSGTPPSGGDDDGGGGGGGGGGGSTPPPDACRWVTFGGGVTASSFPQFADVPGDWLVQTRVCPGDITPFLGSGGFRVLDPGAGPPPPAPPAPPTPEEVAEIALAQVRAFMERPDVAADPPLDVASIINLPVFVQVTNWVDEIAPPPVCVLTTCVNIRATPQLSFDPGEPGAPTIPCTAPGTRFDPAGGDPVDQAQVPGACAYVYRMRTGAAGRPEAWPAEVTVTWTVSWSAGAVTGTFPDQVLSTEVPRMVDEVQTVVVEGSTG